MYPILRSLRRARPPPMPAVPTIRYPEGMGSAPHADDAGTSAAEWFAHFSWLHGVRHTQRVHIHAQRLVRELRWP